MRVRPATLAVAFNLVAATATIVIYAWHGVGWGHAQADVDLPFIIVVAGGPYLLLAALALSFRQDESVSERLLGGTVLVASPMLLLAPMSAGRLGPATDGQAAMGLGFLLMAAHTFQWLAAPVVAIRAVWASGPRPASRTSSRRLAGAEGKRRAHSQKLVRLSHRVVLAVIGASVVLALWGIVSALVWSK